MKLKGLARSTAPHFAERASHFVDLFQGDPNCAANWSTTINPMLCRVAAYSGPGFPRPAISRIAVSSTRGKSCKAVILGGAKRSQRIPRRGLEINAPGSIDSARDDDGLLLFFLFWSFFFPSWSRRSPSFAFFLFLGDHFRFSGSNLNFRSN